MDEALYNLREVAKLSQDLVLMGNFNHLDICRGDKTAKHKQFRRFLECVDYNLPPKKIEETKRRGFMQDLILTKKRGW